MTMSPEEIERHARNPDPNVHWRLAIRAAELASKRYGVATEELIGRAFIALHDAARTYRPDLGVRFSTHAMATIRWKLREEFMSHAHVRDRGEAGRAAGWWSKRPDHASGTTHDMRTLGDAVPDRPETSVEKHMGMFEDGPLAHKACRLAQCVVMLRAALDPDGKPVTLHRDDDAAPGQQIHVYMMRGKAGVGFWDGRDESGRRVGGTLLTASYRLYPNQPEPEVVCSAERWGRWCTSNQPRLVEEWKAMATAVLPTKGQE